MSGDLNKPIIGDAYAASYQWIRDNFADSAKMYDGTSTANLPSGTIDWNSSTNKWRKWNGSAWTDLSTSYAINISGSSASCTGAAASANALNAANAYQVAKLGVGVTASSWSNPAVDIDTYGAVYSQSSSFLVGIACNAYYDSGWLYKNTDEAALFEIQNGIFNWYSAASGTAGTGISWTSRMNLDSAGNLTVLGAITQNGGIGVGYKNIPRSTTATTLAIGDVGKCVAITGTMNIPASVFAAGDAVSLYNDSASATTITISAGTLRLAGTATTGTRTIAARGLATLWFNVGGATPEVIASGNVT